MRKLDNIVTAGCTRCATWKTSSPRNTRKTIHPRLVEIMNADSRPQAERLIEKLARELSRHYPKAAACLRNDVVRMTAYYDFPQAAMEASTNDQHHRIKLRSGVLMDQRRQADAHGGFCNVSRVGAANASQIALAPLQRLLWSSPSASRRPIRLGEATLPTPAMSSMSLCARLSFAAASVRGVAVARNARVVCSAEATSR